MHKFFQKSLRLNPNENSLGYICTNLFLSCSSYRNFFENRVSGLVRNSGSLSDFWSPGYMWLKTHLFQCGPGVRHCHYWNSLGNWSSVSITVLPAPKYRAIGRKCVSSLSSPNLWLSRLSWAPLWRSFAWWHLSMLELSDLQNQDLLTQENRKPQMEL